MSIRIPVSLKFDNTSSFYNDFVWDMKEHKTLSDFIVKMLKLYYENNQVRDAVNLALELDDPIAEVRKQIERAQLEHNKSMMGTHMLESELNKHRTPSDPNTPLLTTSQEPVVSEEVMQRIADIEKSLPSIDSKMDTILNLLQQGNFNINPDNKATSPVEPTPTVAKPVQSPQLTQEIVFIAQDDTKTIHHELPTGISAEKTDNLVVLPTISTPAIPSVVEIQPLPPTIGISIGDDDSEINEVVEEQKPARKVPKSFGKAMKSVAKE